MDETTWTLPTDDGLELTVHRWAPDGEPTAVVQVQHGMAEHGGRYRRFAEALTARAGGFQGAAHNTFSDCLLTRHWTMVKPSTMT